MLLGLTGLCPVVDALVTRQSLDAALNGEFTSAIGGVHLKDLVAKVLTDDSHSGGLANAWWSTHQHRLGIDSWGILPAASPSECHFLFVASNMDRVPISKPLKQACNSSVVTHEII